MNESITWVGMDVHSRSVTIAAVTGHEQQPVVRELANDKRKVLDVLKKLSQRGRVQACYEAGPCGFELQRVLVQAGISCAVIAPSLIPARPGERIKTDKRDAIKLARLYRAGELVPVVVPSEDQEAARDLLRARDDVRKARIAARHQLTKFLLRHGRHFVEATNWTDKHRAWLRAQQFEQPTLRATFRHYRDHLNYLDERMDELDAEIKKLASDPLFEGAVGRLTCLRGVSILTAMVLATELGDMRRFEHPRQLMAYLGLVPGERSSGEARRRTGITKTGNAHARRILVEAAWGYRKQWTGLSPRARKCARDQPPEIAAISRKATTRLTRRYARLVARGKTPQVAVTAVARELCGFIWAIATAEVPQTH